LSEVTYLEAIRQAMQEEMRSDAKVFVLGEDIAAYGGAFKVTDGLLKEFGALRVIDTPLGEAAIVGASIGAALVGLRPIAEMQFIDFISCAFNEIVNLAAKFHYRSGTPVPMVVRGPSGAGVHGGPFHSQSPEAWFAHTPGLKVVSPATAYDAKGLLISAIRDDNPVIYCENKFLYRRIKEVLPDEEYTVPLGKADVKRAGSTISVITWGAMVHQALEAAAELEGEGISLEVLDLRTISPLDREAIAGSVTRTSRALVVEEDNRSWGVGAEVAAFLVEELFDSLDAPVLRVAAPDTPVPYSPPLEEAYLPRAEDIVRAARRLAKY
jgi:2-oxoisovalerate dehydrogenase E1 component beta subunit